MSRININTAAAARIEQRMLQEARQERLLQEAKAFRQPECVEITSVLAGGEISCGIAHNQWQARIALARALQMGGCYGILLEGAYQGVRYQGAALTIEEAQQLFAHRRA